MNMNHWNIERAKAKRENLFKTYDFDQFREDWGKHDENAEKECLIIWAMLNGREEYAELSEEARQEAIWEGYEFLIESPRSRYLAVS